MDSTRKISKIKFHYPELMSPKAEELILALYDLISAYENKIAGYHDEILKCQDRLKQLESEWSKVLEVADIYFEDEENDWSTATFDPATVRDRIIGFKFSSDVNKEIH